MNPYYYGPATAFTGQGLAHSYMAHNPHGNRPTSISIRRNVRASVGATESNTFWILGLIGLGIVAMALTYR